MFFPWNIMKLAGGMLVVSTLPLSSSWAETKIPQNDGRSLKVKRVLLISVDGLHAVARPFSFNWRLQAEFISTD
jgi:hypothetical protein